MLGGDCTLPGVSIFNIVSLKSYSPSLIFLNPPRVVRVYFPVAVNSSLSSDDASRAAQALVMKARFDGANRPRSRFVFGTVIDTLPEIFLKSNLSTTAIEVASSSQMFVMVDVNPSMSADEPTADDLAAAAIDDFNSQNSALVAAMAYAETPTIDKTYNRHASLSFQTCLDSTCASENECVEGHSGPLCTVCLPDYGKTSVFKCAKCSDPALAYFILIAGALAAIFACAILA